MTLPNGVITDFSYNENSWLTNIAAQKLPNSIFTAGYGFDKVGNITQKAAEVNTAYGYDKTYQLINAIDPQQSEAFTYDKVGNRKTMQGTQTPWTFNKNNELLTAETASFGYDDNGNTTSKAEGGATTAFVYGATDRLQSVQLPDGRTAIYTYDPFGRRIKKQVGIETTIYVYADEGLIGEYGDTGVAKKTYGWRPNGIWGTNPLFQAENGNYYFYHNDHLGTPQTLTDINGDIVWDASYEAFGKANIGPDSTITNNLRFPGQYFDEETGNHYNWHRYYDSQAGRYVESDPIRHKGGDVNNYRYAAGSPQSPVGSRLDIGHFQYKFFLKAEIGGTPMARALRIEYEGAFYHVTSRGNDRKKIFTTRRDYEKFKEYVSEAKNRFGFILHCYVLMSNHYHMLIETPDKNLQKIMHHINSSYSIYTNTKRNRCGHLFQGRYKAIIIDKDSYLVELSRYIHLNPVRAKMVERPEDYPYSSYKVYISGMEEQIVSKSNVLGYFPGGILKAQSSYKAFVESVLGEDLESPLNNVYGGGILGDEDFVNEVLANIEDGRLESEDIAHRKALRPSVHIDAILAVVSEHFGVPVDEVLKKDRKLRKICVYLLKRYSDATNQRISELLGQGSYSSAAKLYTRFIEEVDKDEQLKRQLEVLEDALSIVKVRPCG